MCQCGGYILGYNQGWGLKSTFVILIYWLSFFTSLKLVLVIGNLCFYKNTVGVIVAGLFGCTEEVFAWCVRIMGVTTGPWGRFTLLWNKRSFRKFARHLSCPHSFNRTTFNPSLCHNSSFIPLLLRHKSYPLPCLFPRSLRSIFPSIITVLLFLLFLH